MLRTVLHCYLSVILLAACSGGSTPAPQVAQLAFSINSSVSIDEKTQAIAFTFDVSSFDAAQLSYLISGGTDRNLFSIVPGTGVLSFTISPDFENPQDTNADNVYEVTIQAGDASRVARLNLTVTINNVIEGFQVTRIVSGLNQPLFAAGFVDGSNRLYVLEKAGEIEIVDVSTGLISSTKFLNITNELLSNSERGLLGFALAPDFSSSGTFYVAVTNLSGDSEIRRYQTISGNMDVADPATGDVILTVAQPASNHNGGSIEFGADGFLYIALGDGGGGGDPFANGQDTDTLLGTIMRIDVTGDDFPADTLRDYRIPAGNPFASGGGAPEIFAYGLRNPYRASFDRNTGLMYIADVGQGEHEEVDILDPATDAGANFGWNTREGVAPFNGGANDPSFTGPVIDYTHSGGFGFSVTGGYVYRGGSDLLRGKYIFGDFVLGRVYAAQADQLDTATPILGGDLEELTSDFTPDFGAIDNISSFGVDADNNLYIVDFDGEIFQVAVE